MSIPALNISGVNQSYGKHTVLNDISFQIQQNEFVGLVGINGAGKSTLIKSILDFVSIKSGTINIFGKSHRDNLSRETLSFLPEKFLPPYYLKGKDFLSYMAELNQVKLEQEQVAEIFHILDLSVEALYQPVRQYSKGMAQKLGLAASFLSQRPLLLLDEPMSGLDPKARAFLKEHLLSLKSAGKSLFFSTHLLNDVEHLCDRLIILHNGQIQFDGSPQSCCDTFSKDNIEDAYLACISA